MSRLRLGPPLSRPRAWLHALSAGTLALALAACGGGESSIALNAGNTATPPKLALDALVGSASPDTLLVQIKTVASVARERVAPRAITLPALTSQKDLSTAEPGQPQQIGIARDVAAAADTGATAPLFNWTRLADGSRRAAINVQSPGAKGVRLGLRVEQLPPGTQLRVYAPDADEVTEVAGAEVLRSLQRNLDAGATGAEAYIYWLPTVDGAQAVLEVDLAPDVNPALLKVALPLVSHLQVLPSDNDALLKAAGSCNIDISCTSGNTTTMRAVARMTFTKDGKSYLCTGTLMNNTRQDYVPYFLSANHCISTQAVASSLETYWNYRSATCNSTQLAGDYQRIGGGALLLYASGTTDTSFMRLNSNPPSNATFAGWDASAPTGAGASVFSIHHPSGDLQKYSAGSVTSFANCDSTSSSCTSAAVGGSTFHIVKWSTGVTEGGSSGGALFSSNRQVIGQLYGGTSSCSAPSGWDSYGRFDIAFNASLSQWLSPTTSTPAKLAPVYRFYNTATAAHFYTNNALERDYVVANMPTYRYEGVAYQAYTSQVTDTSAVFRFYNRETGVHFYTINAAERDWIIATNPPFQYEGPSWYARTSAGSGVNALYRFYSALRRSHFYTVNPAERDYVMATYPDFKYEDVAYYVWPAP